MTIATACPHCNKSYHLKDYFAGTKVRCKDCAESFLVKLPRVYRLEEPMHGPREPRSRRQYPQPKKQVLPRWVWAAGSGGVLVGVLVLSLVMLLANRARANPLNGPSLPAPRSTAGLPGR